MRNSKNQGQLLSNTAHFDRHFVWNTRRRTDIVVDKVFNAKCHFNGKERFVGLNFYTIGRFMPT